MNDPFVSSLMDAIMDPSPLLKNVEKSALTTIFSLFIDNVLTETFHGDQDFSGQIITIIPKFPVKHSWKRRSIPVDWLMYNVERKQLLFVNLWTSNKVKKIYKFRTFLQKKKLVLRKGGSILIEELDRFGKGTHKQTITPPALRKILRFKNEIASSHDVQIISIVPRNVYQETKIFSDCILTFRDLTEAIPGPFANEWKIIIDHLRALDEESGEATPDPQRISSIDENIISERNYLAKCDFEEIVKLCNQYGDSILVGFSGGLVKLNRSDYSYLQRRLFKWDYITGGIGKKIPRNWISGTEFLHIVHEKEKSQGHVRDYKETTSQRNSPYWEGTVKFHEMYDLCLKYGNEIIVGFTGGVEELKTCSFSYLETRSFYRWDYAEITEGKKTSDWIHGGLIVELLDQYHNYPGK